MKRYISFWFPGLALCLLFTLNMIGAAQEANLGILSYSMVGGSYTSTEHHGDYVFATTRHGFKIFDVSDPALPLELVHVPTDGVAICAVATDDYVFVCDGVYGLRCYDITDIMNPVYLDRIELEGSLRSCCPLEEESLLYVAMENYGLHLVDYSDPSNLQLVDVFYVGGMATHPVIYNEWLYLTLGNAGLRVYDISDPLNPEQTLIWNTYGGKTGEVFVWPDGEYLTIADEENGFYICDLEFPGIPSWNATVPPDTEAIAISVSGGNSYGVGAYYHKKITTFDLDGDELDVQEVQPFCTHVEVVDDFAYVCCGDSALLIYDCGTPANIQLETVIENTRSVTDVALRGNVAYLANGRSGLAVLDVSNPENPIHVETVPIDGRTNYILMEPDQEYLYLADYYYGLNVYSLADPWQPTLVTTLACDPDTGCTDMIWKDDYLYVTMYARGPCIFDVSDPADPVLTWSSPDTTDYFSSMAISEDGNYLYACARSNGLLIYSVTGPGTIEYEYTIEEGLIYPIDIQIVGDYAYITDTDKGLYVYDISNYAYVFKVDSLEAAFEYWDVSYIGDNMLALGDLTRGVVLVDIADPENIVEIDHHETPGYAGRAASDGSFLYFCDTYSLMIFDLYAPGVHGPFESPGLLRDVAWLHPAYPNPFNPTTTLTFDIQQPGQLKIIVYDVAGREVTTLYNGYAKPGRYTGVFNGENLASGIYFARMQIHEHEQTQKLLYVK